MSDVEIADEAQYRRPDYVDGTNIVLGDGQAWGFRNPVVYFKPAQTESGFQIAAKIGKDRSFGKLLKAYDDAIENDAVMGAGFAIASALLLANYNLSSEQLELLLELDWIHDKSEEFERLRQIMDVAYGRGPTIPKPESGIPSPPLMDQV